MSGDPTAMPWQFRKLRTRLVVRDANGDGPLFIIEGGYNADAVALVEKALRHLAGPDSVPRKGHSEPKP